MDLDSQLGAFFHYLEKTLGKGIPIDLDACANEIALNPATQKEWAFLLMCLYGRHSQLFTEDQEFELARDATKEILRMIDWPMDARCDGETFDYVLESYDKILHPENYPLPERDPVEVCLEAIDRVSTQLNAFGVIALVCFKGSWVVRISYVEDTATRTLIRALFPIDIAVEFDDRQVIEVIIRN